MLLSVKVEDIIKTNIYFGITEKNNIVNNCFFTQILYSTMKYTLTYILLDFVLDITHINETDNYYFIELNKVNPYNSGIIHRLDMLEEHILNYYKHKKTFNNHYTLKQHLQNNTVKIRKTKKINVKTNKLQMYLKISGVWENMNNKVGLIYKFYIGEECIPVHEYLTKKIDINNGTM